MKGKDVFCNRKVLADQIYYETKHTIILYDIRPYLPGHSLAIPKRHITDFSELTKEEALDLFSAIKKVVPALLKRYKCDSYTLTAQVGKNAGMTVNHFHMHILPRKKGDRYSDDDNRIYGMLYGEIGRMSAKRKWIYSETAALRKQLEAK